MTTRRSRTVALMSAILLAGAPAVAADRLTDRDVKALVEKIDDGRDRFEGALDGDVKRSIVRSPTGEMDVTRALDDFQESVSRLKDRLKPEYSASTEAAAVLRRASALDAFLKQQPAGLKGASEWSRLAADLDVLASTYGAAFPLAENAPVRRISDRELTAAAEQLVKTGEQLKKSLDADLKKNPSVTAQDRQAAIADADRWSKDAKALRDRVKDGKPSSAEADKVAGGTAKMKSFLDARSLQASAAVWAGASGALQTMAQAYGASAK